MHENHQEDLYIRKSKEGSTELGLQQERSELALLIHTTSVSHFYIEQRNEVGECQCSIGLLHQVQFRKIQRGKILM